MAMGMKNNIKCIKMQNNFKFALSSSDDDYQNTTLSTEGDPLIEILPETGNKRNLRARGILMTLRERSSEDGQQQEPIQRENVSKVKSAPAKVQKQRFKSEIERMDRRRLLARQRSQRARDRKRAMSITFTSATKVVNVDSCAGIKGNTNDLKESFVKKEMTADEFIQMLDPLQSVNDVDNTSATAIKEEPCDLEPSALQAAAVDPLNSSAIITDVNKSEKGTAEKRRSIRTVKMEQTKRIAGVLNKYDELDDDDAYNKRVPRYQMDKMRLYHSRRKSKKTIAKNVSPERYASLGNHAESSCLMDKESTKNGLTLAEECSTSLDELKRMLSGSGIGENDHDGESSSCDSIQIKKVDSARKRSAMRQRERRARETQAETEARLLRQRISQMKLRLYTQIMSTEEEIKADRERKCMEMRLKRQRRREAETPEQAAARKTRESRIYAESRNRIKAIETPEETAARRAFSRERNRKRYKEIKAKETPEQRSTRKERERQYRENYKRRKMEKTQTEQSVNAGN